MKIINCSKLLLVIFLSLGNSAFANDLKSWPVIVQSGKGTEFYTTTRTMSLIALQKTIYPIENYEVKHSVFDKKQKIKVTYIGKLSGIKVYDLIYPLKNSYYKYLKLIVLERKTNQYVPVFYDLIDSERYVHPLSETIRSSSIITEHHLIISELPLIGTGAGLDGFYLFVPPDILRNKNAIPKWVNTDLIPNLLKKRLPKGYYTPSANAFNIKTLHFHSCVTKTDAHCFDGRVYDTLDMQFKLVNGTLKLISFKYRKSR